MITQLGRTVHTVDLESSWQRTGVSRSDLVAKLNSWNDGQFIDLTTGGVVNVFRVTENWPPTATEAETIVDELYKDMEAREQQELQRMDQVMSLITGKGCFAKTLAQHFGDSLPNNAAECGHCE
jgi:hypothetical protein